MHLLWLRVAAVLYAAASVAIFPAVLNSSERWRKICVHLGGLAFFFHFVSAVEMLLKEGAPVNAKNIYGNGPLFVAVFYSAGDGQVIRLLREHGADPTAVNDSGQSALGLSRLIANYNVAQFFEDLP